MREDQRPAAFRLFSLLLLGAGSTALPVAWSQDAIEVKTSDASSVAQIRFSLDAGAAVTNVRVQRARFGFLTGGSAGYLNISSDAASTPVGGDIRYVSSDSTVQYYDGSAWRTIGWNSGASGNFLRKNPSTAETSTGNMTGALYSLTNSATANQTGRVLDLTVSSGDVADGTYYGLYSQVVKSDNTDDAKGVANIGVGGYATGTTQVAGATTDNFGLYGSASASAGPGVVTNYGLYATASLGSTNWAGYFDSGDVFLRNRLALSQSSPTALLHIGTTGTLGHLRMDGIAGNPATITAGDHWYNTTQRSHRFGMTAGTAGLVGLLSATTSDSSAISNTTDETNFDRSYTLAANALTAGKVLRIRASGKFSTGTSSTTITLRVKYGSTVLMASASASVAAGLSNRGWMIEAVVICRTAGAGGTATANGCATIDTANSAATNAGTTSIDTTAATALQASAQWGAANAGHTITQENLTVEVLD